ncbi:MAG: glycosyltransferase, partial [Bryobacteraceae bacterium]|nr:glycosyltransferase [Bryobacteraceae bacterium]
RGPKRVDDLPAEIRLCDLGVIPNQKNAFTDINTPTRIFEYLAMGKPVIAPRTAGITDYFDAASLYFFEPGNAQDLAATLRGAMLDPAGRGRLAAAGQRIFARHTWSQEREVLLQLVERLQPAQRS